MTALSPSSPYGPAAGLAAPASEVLWWRTALREKMPAVALFTLVVVLWNVPLALQDGKKWGDLAWQSLFGATVQGVLLVGLMSLAERFVPPGRRTLAYAGAAVLATTLASIIDLLTLIGLGVWPSPRYSFVATLWSNLGDYLVQILCFVFIYDYRLRLRNRLRALQDIRMNRARVVRETVESKLQAMQARVDPQFLFETMRAVEDIYARDSAKGDRLLNDLIAYLRAALPDLRNTTSTLNREIELARAYVDIRRAILDHSLQLHIEVPPRLQMAAFPPMCLVPMLQFVLCDTTGDNPVLLTLRVDGDGSSIKVAVCAEGDFATDRSPGLQAIDAMRHRLRDLYAERTSVAFIADSTASRRVLLEIPYEHPVGPDRRG